MHEHNGLLRTRGINLCSADSFGLVWVKYVGTLGDGVLRPEAAACIQWPESGSAAQSGNTRHRENTLWGDEEIRENKITLDLPFQKIKNRKMS